MASAHAARIPVTVLTGFLGSGKTTLLNALLRRPELADTAVIVNEIGAVDIDRALLAGAADDVVLLDSGCLCCAMLNSLRETLASIYERRARGELPPFRRVVVETTGLADPAPILQTLLRDGFVTAFFGLHALVATVDARHGEAELDEHAECVAQVGMADRLVVTKTDLTGGVVPESLLARIGALNPHATVTSVRPGVLDPAAVLGLDDAGERSAEAVPSAGAARLFAAPVANARHATDIVTESFVIERPATWSGLAGWMDAVREFFGAKMLRCKGLLLVAEAGRPVVVQGVQGVFAQPETLAGWPGEDHRSRLVCISRGLEPGLVQASLGLLHAEAGTYRPATLAELKHAAAAPRGTTP